MKIKNKDIELEIPDSYLLDDKAVNNLMLIINVINNTYNKNNNVYNKNINIDDTNNKCLDKVRRLPNKINNLNTNNTPKFKPKKMKAYSYFKCPDCGQSIVICVDNNYYIRDIKENKIYCIPQDVLLSSNLNTFNDYNNLLQKAKKYNNTPVNIFKTKDVKGQCLKCGKENNLDVYIDAYENSQKYFEYETCPLCGKEMCETISDKSSPNEIVKKCEKCDYSYSIRKEEEE